MNKNILLGISLLSIILTLTSVSAQSSTYFYAGSKTLAVKDTQGDVKYLHQDRLGSDVETKSLPFGQVIRSGERFGFTGKERDTSGLHYFAARYYDSSIGRFTSVDPVTTNHAYAYVHNNAMNRVDYDGRKDYALIVGFRSLDMNAMLSAESVVWTLTHSRTIDEDDTLKIIIAYHPRLEGHYFTPEQEAKDQDALSVLKGNLLGKSAGGLSDGMLDLPFLVHIYRVMISVDFAKMTTDKTTNMEYLRDLFVKYDEVITLSHGTTQGKSFSFLDGMAQTTFREYVDTKNWLDISCGSTCPEDKYSHHDIYSNLNTNSDRLVRLWSQVNDMVKEGTSLKKSHESWIGWNVKDEEINKLLQQNHPLPIP